MWLWPPVIQKELDRFREMANSRRMRKQKNKILPSGVSPNLVYTLPERFGAHDCLQPVECRVVQTILNDMQAEQDYLTNWSVTPTFAKRCKQLLPTAGIQVEKISLETVWMAFNALVRFL